jgi:hypothetical protein
MSVCGAQTKIVSDKGTYNLGGIMFDFMDSVVILSEQYKHCVGYAICELYGSNRVSVRVFDLGGSMLEIDLPCAEVMNLQPLLECNHGSCEEPYAIDLQDTLRSDSLL